MILQVKRDIAAMLLNCTEDLRILLTGYTILSIYSRPIDYLDSFGGHLDMVSYN